MNSDRRKSRAQRRPWGRILLVLFQIVWLNAFLPGHTRGQITIGGDPACASASVKCCPRTGTPVQSDGAPTKDQRERCAVCFFAKGLSNDAGPVLALAELGLIDVTPPDAGQAAPAVERIDTYQGRGPPMA